MFWCILILLWPKNPRANDMYGAVTVTLSRDEMERRRLEAAEDLQKGITQARVARKFGVSRTTASRWCRTLEVQGMERLRKRKAPGRPSRLSSSQLVEVREIFAAGPRAFGFETDRWTTARLAQAIETRFAIRYDPDHVGRLMHRLGLRPKPEPVCEVYGSPVAGIELRLQ
jgi:transposase